jgi:hypothetical protein
MMAAGAVDASIDGGSFSAAIRPLRHLPTRKNATPTIPAPNAALTAISVAMPRVSGLMAAGNDTVPAEITGSATAGGGTIDEAVSVPADSDEVARAFRDDAAHGFRHDVAHGACLAGC